MTDATRTALEALLQHAMAALDPCAVTKKAHVLVTEHVQRGGEWVPLTFCKDCKRDVVLTVTP